MMEQEKKLMLVINPTAGKNRARDNLFMLIDYFFTHGYHVTVFPTQAKGDACDYVAEFAPDYDAVVCVGGDGTLNETVTGLMFFDTDRRPLLGYIPAGSTNDFANTLGISNDMRQAAEQFCTGTPYRCDIGRFNGRYFTYVAAFGVFTDVSYGTPQPLKNALGHAAYILEGVKSLTSIKRYHLTVNCDGEELEDDFIYGQFSNSTSIGGILNIGRTGVQLDDGLFEVILIQMPNSLIALNNIVAALMSQKVEDCPNIYFRRAKRITVTSEVPLSWTLDGEAGGSFTYSQAEIIPGAVNLSLGEPPKERLAAQQQLPQDENPEQQEQPESAPAELPDAE